MQLFNANAKIFKKKITFMLFYFRSFEQEAADYEETILFIPAFKQLAKYVNADGGAKAAAVSRKNREKRAKNRGDNEFVPSETETNYYEVSSSGSSDDSDIEYTGSGRRETGTARRKNCPPRPKKGVLQVSKY